LHTQHFLYSALSPVSLFIGEWRSIDSNPCAEPTTTMTKSHGGWRKVDKNVDNCYSVNYGEGLKGFVEQSEE